VNYDQFIEDLNGCLDHLPRLPINILHDEDATWEYATGLRKLAKAGTRYTVEDGKLQRMA